MENKPFSHLTPDFAAYMVEGILHLRYHTAKNLHVIKSPRSDHKHGLH